MIHLFARAGMHLALDTGSGAVHLLDQPAYLVLETVSEQELRTETITSDFTTIERNFDKQQLETAFYELCELTKQGLLYADDSYTEFQDMLGLSPIKALCLHIAHDCNLRCRYCFASTGGFGGTRKLMDFDTAKKAIDLLIQESQGRRNLEVDFFGGEPLMNYEVVRQVIEYARGLEKAHNKNFRFTITTNGLLLKEDIIDEINQEMSNVVLSIDGRKETNDRLRVTTGGSGSYDTILPKYQQLVSKRGEGEYYVRGTYTRHNLDFDKDVLALYDAGFEQISVEPVVGPEEDDYSIRQCDIQAIEKSYERLMHEMIKRRKTKQNNFNFFHFMLDLQNGPCAIKRLKGCGSGNEYIAVTPDGEIYPCHQFVGNTDFIMGTVDGGITNTALKQKFANANLLNKSACQSCWAKFFCSGGCNANNHTYAGDILQPHTMSCELEKIRLECAIALQAAYANN